MTLSASDFLPPLQRLVRALEADLHERVAQTPALAEQVTQEHAAARAADRTGESLEAFTDDVVTQAAVAWVLAAVFVRFLEDNGLLDPELAASGQEPERWIAGSTRELCDLAREREREFYRQRRSADEQPAEERQYLLHVFETIGLLPGMDRLFDPEHNPLWRLGPSADGARELLETFRARDAASGDTALVFASAGLDTRFLGDLYQDLSEAARKRYALLQTPKFVEEFLLDRTLAPAINELGLDAVKLIDPACGSGHFLLGAFDRLFGLRVQAEPAANPRVLAQRALDQVTGVDLNPFAAAIARFRLLVAALHACGVRRLAGAPDFDLRVATGDSLLHGRRPASAGQKAELFERSDLRGAGTDHYYASEDRRLLARIFADRYPVVVANPPYITVKDAGLRDAYRSRYESCHGKYSLVCPFLERIFDLATESGYVGMIVANSFMKREFGRKLIETVLPRWDLTHVVDSSGAYIPEHGTPTVILFGRARPPLAPEVRVVMGIRGEPSSPKDPAAGRVWTAILAQIDHVRSESEWVSVEGTPRKVLGNHPWSLRGGAASRSMARLNSQASTVLGELIESIGITAVTGEDEIFVFPDETTLRRIGVQRFRTLVFGDIVRDWEFGDASQAIWTYDDEGTARLDQKSAAARLLWRARSRLDKRKRFGVAMLQKGSTWWEWQELYYDKLQTPLAICFAFVATHNHFVLARGGRVFNRTAPVIKLLKNATLDDHLGLLGLLNSSAASFWLKNTLFERGGGGVGGGIASEAWERFYEHDATKLKKLPLPKTHPVHLGTFLDRLAKELAASRPSAVARHELPIPSALKAAGSEHETLRRRMIALQEELDWRCYHLYGLLDDLTLPDAEEPPEVELGERAFEIALARRVAAGELETRWFERHGSTPRTDVPDHWPTAYRELVERRLAAIAQRKDIRLIERPEYKRRWVREPWESEKTAALRDWLLDRLEAEELWKQPRLTTVASLADRIRRDDDFLRVAELWAGREDLDLTRVVGELIEPEAVPFLARHRYKATGLRKRGVWERVWDLQRQEDALDAKAELSADHPDHLSEAEAVRRKAALDIPVPPKYKSTDFAKPSYWRLRGKLDVPKERFIVYPGAERGADPTPVVGWAGWDTLQRAEALATWYVEARDVDGWSEERRQPLLDGLAELVPWLLQWHNELDRDRGLRLGDYYRSFLEEERRRFATE